MKPVFTVILPEWGSEKEFDDITEGLQKTLPEYNVIVAVDNSKKGITFECFYEKGCESIKYEVVNNIVKAIESI